MPEEPIKIFYSYSRKDLEMRNTLEDHLSALREANRISTWHDLQLEAGTEWEPAILNKLDTADIILLLVSRNFIASKYCYGTELQRAIARHTEGTARVIPIILRPCDWNHDYVPFSKLNVLPDHAEPITGWADQDAAFTIVARRIRQTVDELTKQKLAEQQAQAQQRQAQIAQQEAEQRAERERLQQEQQAEEQERQELLERQRRKEEIRRQLTVKTDELASEKGIDYTKLRDLLQANQWKEADRETYLRMLEAVGRKDGDWIRAEELRNFPCADLQTIDRLWVKYSNGHFGFSVQKKIWQACGSPTSRGKDWDRFCVEVGWKSSATVGYYAALKFNNDESPAGELPGLRSMWVVKESSWRWRGFMGILGIETTHYSRVSEYGVSSLSQRLINCSTSRS